MWEGDPGGKQGFSLPQLSVGARAPIPEEMVLLRLGTGVPITSPERPVARQTVLEVLQVIASADTTSV
jgi:hypothetical protein